MSGTQTQIQWNPTARAKYEEMTSKIPLFHREIAKQVVDKKAVINAQGRNASQVEEEDIIRAFLTEVPAAFYSLMIRLMDEVGFNYKKFEQ
jgi:hypothetical protein